MKTPPADLLAKAKTVLPYAYAPYSHFQVAAAVRVENGEIFTGCNVENASSPAGICAEGGAISAAFAHGHKKIKEVLVLVADDKICPPCGVCRQRFVEFASPETIIHLCTLDGKYQSHTLKELMPFAFNAQNLE